MFLLKAVRFSIVIILVLGNKPSGKTCFYNFKVKKIWKTFEQMPFEL